MKTVTTTVKEGSPMTVESRIFSVAEYVQPSEGEPIRSVVLETRDSIIVVWHVHPGQEIGHWCNGNCSSAQYCPLHGL